MNFIDRLEPRGRWGEDEQGDIDVERGDALVSNELGGHNLLNLPSQELYVQRANCKLLYFLLVIVRGQPSLDRPAV